MLNSHVAGKLFVFYAFRTIVAVLNTIMRIYVILIIRWKMCD